MSAPVTRARDAEEGLAGAGFLALRVESAGPSDEIAVVKPDEDGVRLFLEVERQRIVDECRSAGFRYVALHLY